MNKARPLLWLTFNQQLDEASLKPLGQQLEAANWNVYPVCHAEAAAACIEKQITQLGLITITPNTLQKAITFLHSQEKLTWIALLHHDIRADLNICHQILRHLYDYHSLPVDLPRLLQSLGHAHGMISLISQSQTVALQKDGETSDMVGSSDCMRQIQRDIRKIAVVDVPVLIAGESGTGKELTAHAIHQNSKRHAGPLIIVNCGAIPVNLIQSELFGHEKGSFTGALTRKIGKIEAAAGGTLFLDEIGDLPLDLQVNLLRFLQEGTITRLGDTVDRQVDARVISATHVNLETAVEEKRFREDLYYRLNVVKLQLPPLRDRHADIDLLANYFFKKFNHNPHIQGFSQQAKHMLHQYHWPGNVRELMNRIRSAVVMCEHRLLTPHDLRLERRTDQREIVTLETVREQAEKMAIHAAVKRNRGNCQRAAKELGISRVTLYRLLKKYELETPDESETNTKD